MALPSTPPSRRVLRLFALSWSLLCAAAAWGVARLAPGTPAWLLPAGAAAFFAAGLGWPALMRTPYRWVEAALGPVGRLVSLVLLAVVYFGVFTPFAVLLRLCGWQPLRLKRSAWPSSAWVERDVPAKAADYRWQY